MEAEGVYENVVKLRKMTDRTGDTNGSAGLSPDKNPDRRRRLLVCCLAASCVVLLLGIIAVGVYLTTLSVEHNQLKENQKSLLADNNNLTNINHNLSSDVENLKRDNDNLSDQFKTLESNITNLTAEIQQVSTHNQQLETHNQQLETKTTQLETQNQQLETQNQQLETKTTQLETQNQQLETQNQQLETKTTQLETQNQQLETEITTLKENFQMNNVSRAQWTINTYCPTITGPAERRCKPCLDQWYNFTSSCYTINNPSLLDELKTWDEAAADCRAKNSHLAVIETEGEKTFVTANSLTPTRYWIGLRAEGGKWKWINGADLNQGSWISAPAADGQCVTSLQDSGWLSESCAERRRWICEQAALTV